MQAHYSRTAHGYSLLELSIVLAVLGLFAGGLATFVTRDQSAKNISLTNARLDEIDDAIKRYYVRNGYLPCPASATTAESSASFGASTDCTIAAPAGTTDVTPATGTSTDALRKGVVPFRELGLSPRYMYDAWNNRINYTVIKALTVDRSGYDDFETTTTNGLIQMLDAPSGDSIIPGSTSFFIEYVLVSPGSDQKGGYNQTGALYAVCTPATPTADSENCDGDETYLDMPLNETTTAANYFNDFIKWGSRDDLEIFSESDE
ncbi:MAG: type II secretion system protein [Rickettsiales bacterium]